MHINQSITVLDDVGDATYNGITIETNEEGVILYGDTELGVNDVEELDKLISILQEAKDFLHSLKAVKSADNN